jgi:hypothetical protein
VSKDKTLSIEFLGPAFTGFKGKEAINKLLEERQGYIKEAFYRDDIGNIALIWGDKSVGLEHIIYKRSKQNINLEMFFNELTDLIENGILEYENFNNSYVIKYENKRAIISYTKNDITKLNFLVTAYREFVNR